MDDNILIMWPLIGFGVLVVLIIIAIVIYYNQETDQVLYSGSVTVDPEQNVTTTYYSEITDPMKYSLNSLVFTASSGKRVIAKRVVPMSDIAASIPGGMEDIGGVVMKRISSRGETSVETALGMLNPVMKDDTLVKDLFWKDRQFVELADTDKESAAAATAEKLLPHGRTVAGTALLMVNGGPPSIAGNVPLLDRLNAETITLTVDLMGAPKD